MQNAECKVQNSRNPSPRPSPTRGEGDGARGATRRTWFVVESICGQFAKFGEATAAQARLTLVEKSEDATRFSDEPSAKVRALAQIPQSQFTIVPVNEFGRVIVPDAEKKPARMRPNWKGPKGGK